MLANASSTALVDVLVKSAAAILLGFACVKLNFINVAKGDMKALGFYVGKIALPLLVFNTVVSANLGAVSWGLVLACNLPKIGGFLLAFLAGFIRRGEVGERITLGTLFGFFVVASNDFALGFPIINALYPPAASTVPGLCENLIPYLAINALIANSLFVPFVLILLQVGRSNTGNAQNVARAWRRVAKMLVNIFMSPIIFAVLIGVLWGRFGPLQEVNGEAQLPRILNGILVLFTSPFTMLALFLTGTAVDKLTISVRVLLLVIGKVFLMATASFALSVVFVDVGNAKVNDKFHGFAYLYGSIATSSAPLVFSNEFARHLSPDIASAIILGIIMSGSSMFASSLIFAATPDDLTVLFRTLLNCLELSGVPCAVLCVFIFVGGRKWFSAPLVNTFVMYVLATIGYMAITIFFAEGYACEDIRNHEQEHASFFLGWASMMYAFCQNSCFGFIMLLQIQRLASRTVHWLGPVIVLLLSLATGFLFEPPGLAQLCALPRRTSLAGAPLVSTVVLVFELVIVWPLRQRDECQRRFEPALLQVHDAETGPARQASDVETLPGCAGTGLARPSVGVTLRCTSRFLWVSLTVRAALQCTLNLVALASASATDGAFAQARVVSSLAEHSQLLVVTLILLFHDDFAAPIRRLIRRDDPLVVLPMSEAPPTVQDLFVRAREDLVALRTSHKLMFRTYRHTIRASEVVSLLVTLDPSLSRADAVREARLLCKFGFLKRLNGGTKLLYDADLVFVKISDDPNAISFLETREEVSDVSCCMLGGATVTMQRTRTDGTLPPASFRESVTMQRSRTDGTLPPASFRGEHELSLR